MSTSDQSPLASAYFRFLQLVQAVQQLPDGSHLDANETALLEAVVLRWHQGQPMTVREAINLPALGSPATLHKRITRLRARHMLETHSIEGDRRAKYLIPTKEAMAYFEQLGSHLHQVQMSAPA